MRLLHAKDFTFKEFVGRSIPEYAIISHRWSEEELTYQDFIQGRENFLRDQVKGYGWTKIVKAGEIASRFGLKWVWIDTCCIDKKSSAELSEAINSMYRWYEHSRLCFVFLPDVRDYYFSDAGNRTKFEISGGTQEFSAEEFKASVWFTRVWTLQELLAPSTIYFYNSAFRYIGDKAELSSHISSATGIDRDYLNLEGRSRPKAISRASVAERMKWAAFREATREEDIAYSLLGLFDVNMPLLYGEGNKAFSRLQSEILKTSLDESIFAWQFGPSFETTGLLAPDILYFAQTKVAYRNQVIPRRHYEKTNKGLLFTIPTFQNTLDEALATTGKASVLVPLNCFHAVTMEHGTFYQQLAIRVTVLRDGMEGDYIPNSSTLLGRREEGSLVVGPLAVSAIQAHEAFMRQAAKRVNMKVAEYLECRTDRSIYFPNEIYYQ